MDTVKIGKFISQLRKEKKMTQEQLGEKIGVTNKTVSRWENGNYMPPVEMFLELSKVFDVSINELLSGERLKAEEYIEKAEENIQEVLKNSSFTVKEKTEFYRKKWKKEHLFSLVIELTAICTAFIIGIIIDEGLIVFGSYICLLVMICVRRNRMACYIENKIYGNLENKK